MQNYVHPDTLPNVNQVTHWLDIDSLAESVQQRRPSLYVVSPTPTGTMLSHRLLICEVQRTSAIHSTCNVNTAVAAWRSSNVVGRINEVTLRRAWLVLGRVTVFGRQTISVFHRATQANSASHPQRDGK